MQFPNPIIVVIAFALSIGTAQAGAYGDRPDVSFGQKTSEPDLELLNIDIQTSTGLGLPPGEGTVTAGRQVYETQCLVCHGPDAKGGPVYSTMVGGIGSMTQNPRVLTPGSMYPYAPILFDYIRRAMPMNLPQSLTADEIYAVSAYIYHLNDLVSEDFRMNAATMPKIVMPNRDAFIEDDRPDVKAVRCMTECKAIGTVADAKRN